MATQPNWWESAPLAPANDPSFTGYIPGNPKPKANDPPSGYVWTNGPGSSLKPISGGPADKPPGDPKVQEAERTAAFLATNLTANIGIMNKALKVDPSAAAPTWGQKFAGFFGADVKNSFTPAQRQIVDNSQKLITDAALTLGTGAAYTPVQLEAYQRGFFPQINDDEATIKAKHEALRAALIAARIKAGNQAPQIDAAMKALGMDPSAPLTASPDDALKLSGSGGGNRPTGLNAPLEASAEAAGVTNLSADQQKAYAAFMATNPDASGLKTFLEGMTGKTVTNADKILAAYKQGRPLNTAVEDLSYKDKLRARISAEDKIGMGTDPATTLAMQGGTLNLSDEASGVGNALAGVVAAPFTGKFDPVGDYRLGRDEERMRIADARQQLGYGGTAIEFASGAASAAPSAALSILAPKAAAAAAGKAGAVGGALAGFGSGEGAAQSGAGLGVGALGGYALGRYAPAAIERVLPKRLRAPQGMAPDLADAAQAEGVDLIRPMVDPASRSDYGALESNVYSQPIIRGAAARVRGQVEDRVSQLAPGGAALEPNAAGDVIQAAGNRFITRSRNIKNRLYDRAESLGGNTAVKTDEAQGQIAQELAQLNEAPETNGAEISFMERLKSDLSQPQTVGSIRRIRTSLRGQINQANLTATTAEARALRVLDAAKNDIQRDAPPAAASAYARADAFNRERQTHIDTVLREFLGKRDQPLDSEKAFARLKSLASPGGGGRRLAAIMRNLEPDERQDIAATIAQSLGRRAADEPFSTALFVSQTSKLSPAARRTIFGPDGAQSIENLRLLSRRLEEAEKDINRSRSATVLERQGIRSAARAFIAGIAGIGGQAATGSISGGVAGLTVAGAAMGASATRRVLSARAMVNPRVSRWLAESAQASTPAQAKEATRKLSVIIAREPALSHELRPIYDFLENRLAQPLAADPKQSGGANDQQQ